MKYNSLILDQLFAKQILIKDQNREIFQQISKMHHYGKYKGRKEPSSPHILEKQEPYSVEVMQLPFPQFRDTHSSIVYESAMGERYPTEPQNYQEVNHFQSSGVMVTDPPAHDFAEMRNSRKMNHHLRSVRAEDMRAVNTIMHDLSRQSLERKSNKSRSGKKLKKNIGSSGLKNLQDELADNQFHVLTIQAKARAVQEQLLKMQNIDASSYPRHSRKNSLFNKSPSLNSHSKRSTAFMQPTESYKNKSMGKITSKQRLMEVFDFLEQNNKKQKKTTTATVSVEKKKQSARSKKQTVASVMPRCIRKSVRPVENPEIINTTNLGARPKSANRNKTPITSKKAKLFLEPPKSSFQSTSSQLFKPQNSYQAENKITVTKSNVQPYLDCKAQYFSQQKSQSRPQSTEAKSLQKPKPKQRTRQPSTTEIVHFRVAQMQNKYQQVFNKKKDEEAIKTLKLDRMEDEGFYKTEMRKTPQHIDLNMTDQGRTPKEEEFPYMYCQQQRKTPTPRKNGWNSSTTNDRASNNVEKRQKDLRQKIGKEYLVSLRVTNRKSTKSRSGRNSNVISPNPISPPQAISPLNQSSFKSSFNNTRNQQSIQEEFTTTHHSIVAEERRISPKHKVSFEPEARSFNISFEKEENKIVSVQRKQKVTSSQVIQKAELQNEKESKLNKMQNRLKYLHSTFGAVMKGYKTRRIFHNNLLIRKYRLEFREIIQFAYNLKKDIENSSEESHHQLLVTALKDLMSKRHQFSSQIQKLLCEECEYTNSTEWLTESQPREIQPLVYDNAFLRMQRSKSKRDFSNSPTKFDEQILRRPNSSFMRNSLPESRSDTQRIKFRKPYAGAEEKSERQITFGNTLNQSRNISNFLESPNSKITRNCNSKEEQDSPVRRFQISQDYIIDSIESQRLLSIEEKSYAEARIQSVQTVVKKEFLRKGSNSRTKFDPSKSIEQDRERKRSQSRLSTEPLPPAILKDEPLQSSPTPQKQPVQRTVYLVSTPIKERNILEKASAQRLSELRDKYRPSSSNSNSRQRLTPIKRSQSPYLATTQPSTIQQPLRKSFISKIPRLTCSIEREQSQKHSKNGSIDQQMPKGRSSVPAVATRRPASQNRNGRQSQQINEKEKFEYRWNQTTKSSTKGIIQKNATPAADSPFNARKSNESFITNQIPMMSPWDHHASNGDFHSSFKVVKASELPSMHESPSRKSITPFTRQNRNSQESIELAEINLELKKQTQSSPALSLNDKFMNEIFQRCSPLKRTSFINNYLTQTNVESPGNVKSSEVKMFSPEPQPTPLKVSMTAVERKKPSIPQPDTIREATTIRRKKTKAQASDLLNLDYKMQIYGGHNDKQFRNEKSMFDPHYQESSVEDNSVQQTNRSSCFNENGALRSQRAIMQEIQQTLGSKNASHSNSTFRIKPLQVNNMSGLSVVSKPQITVVPDSPFKRTKYSPEKQSSPDKENFQYFDKLTHSRLNNNSKKELNTRRRSRGMRNQKSVSRQTPNVKEKNAGEASSKSMMESYQPVVRQPFQEHKSYIKNRSPALLKMLGQQQSSSFKSPERQSTLFQKMDRLGLVKQSNNKSPHVSILEEKNRRESTKQRNKNVHQHLNMTTTSYSSQRIATEGSIQSAAYRDDSQEPLNLLISAAFRNSRY